MRRWFALALLSLFLVPVFVAAAPAIVILVRHAEKEAAPADNPHLTPAGRARAEELSKLVDILMQKFPLRAIFTTDFLRTRQTAAPLSAASHVALTVTNDDPTAQVLAIQGGMVVIVGHGDTVPKLIEALGGPAGIVIADNEFNRFFALAAPGTLRAKLADSTYGK
jgi:phosphohistidine phosphatase SixA